MWVTWQQDEQAILYWNLSLALEIRFLKLAVLLDGYQEILRNPREEFGNPDSLVMAIIGPTMEEFKFIVSLPPGEQQARKFATLEKTVREGLQNGVKLLDLKKIVEEA